MLKKKTIIIKKIKKVKRSVTVQTCLLSQLLEEPLVEDEGHTRDLLHLGFSRGVSILKVGRDSDGEFPAELFTPETCSEKSNRCRSNQTTECGQDL